MARPEGDLETFDRERIERARRGDRFAFDELFRAHRDRVYGLAMRMTGDSDMAQDVLVEAFAVAWDRLADFRGKSRFSTWVCAIALNGARERLRKAGRDAGRYEPLGEHEASARSVGHEEAIDLERAIARLPAGAREALLLRHVYGFSCAEAAEAMNVTSGTIKSQTYRACALLRESLSYE